MTRDQRHAMWQARIAAFKANGESSVKTCWIDNNVRYMHGSKKIGPKRILKILLLNEPILESKSITLLLLSIGAISIQIEEDFNPILLGEVLQVIQYKC